MNTHSTKRSFYLLVALMVVFSICGRPGYPVNAENQIAVILPPTGTVRVSVISGGGQANGPSANVSVSDTGRYTAFVSSATNLAAGDTNAFDDIYRHDLLTGDTVLVSIGLLGAAANDASAHPSISADGRYVAFESSASNLISGDVDNYKDIFVRDMLSGSTVRVSVNSDEEYGVNWSQNPSISGDGRYVAFKSYATNLVDDDTNGHVDVFVRDTVGGTTLRASESTAGVEANNWCLFPAISANGQYVTFQSSANTLVLGDANARSDIFVHDTQTAITSLASLANGGMTQGNEASNISAISGDGRYVAFGSSASNLVANDNNGASDVFVRDTQTNVTTIVSIATNGTQGNDSSFWPSITSDGRYIVYISYASTLVNGDTNGFGDIILHDRNAQETMRLSINTTGGEANNGSDVPAISRDGTYVAYKSLATNLVINDTNAARDIFEIPAAGEQATTSRLSVSLGGNGNGSVTSSPAGIDCGTDCLYWYLAETEVTLTAHPAPYTTFAGWSGTCIGTGTCMLPMAEARYVVATFIAPAFLPLIVR